MQCSGVKEGNIYKDWAVANGLTTVMMPSEAVIDNIAGTVEAVAIAVMGKPKRSSQGRKAVVSKARVSY